MGRRALPRGGSAKLVDVKGIRRGRRASHGTRRTYQGEETSRGWSAACMDRPIQRTPGSSRFHRSRRADARQPAVARGDRLTSSRPRGLAAARSCTGDGERGPWARAAPWRLEPAGRRCRGGVERNEARARSSGAALPQRSPVRHYGIARAVTRSASCGPPQFQACARQRGPLGTRWSSIARVRGREL
jgi:hypothetical protein